MTEPRYLNGVTWPVTPPIRSPLCIYQPQCPTLGVATVGPFVRVGDSLNREFHCQTCGIRGIESRVCCA